MKRLLIETSTESNHVCGTLKPHNAVSMLCKCLEITPFFFSLFFFYSRAWIDSLSKTLWSPSVSSEDNSPIHLATSFSPYLHPVIALYILPPSKPCHAMQTKYHWWIQLGILQLLYKTIYTCFLCIHFARLRNCTWTCCWSFPFSLRWIFESFTSNERDLMRSVYLGFLIVGNEDGTMFLAFAIGANK